jgi:hypothetical protein
MESSSQMHALRMVLFSKAGKKPEGCFIAEILDIYGNPQKAFASLEATNIIS